ncbi:tyrosine-protein phosphatase [Aspergillus undulatus]|uniref:tyrosine-protein phosphatase n=1 Tax=Aspergillus undulatus TaxID=1810928 RepID=UPI003CCD5D15
MGDNSHAENAPSSPGTTIRIDGVFNVRGFGGYRTALGPNSITRNGLLYRSGHLRDITPQGLEKLRGLGITTIIGLTISEETKALFTDTPSRTAQCKVLNFPLAKSAFSVTQLSEKYKRYLAEGEKAIAEGYLKLLIEGSPVVRDILLYIRDNPSDVFLIHCAMGKDRTGVIFAVLLSLAGVPDDVIADEYSRSEAALEESLPKIAAAINKAMPLIDGAGAMERARIVIKTSEEAMRLTLRMVEEMFGGMMQYVEECCGIDEVDVKKIQEIVIQTPAVLSA